MVIMTDLMMQMDFGKEMDLGLKMVTMKVINLDLNLQKDFH